MSHDETAAHFQARSVQYRSEAAHAANPDLAKLYRLVADGLENVAAALRADPNIGVRNAIASTTVIQAKLRS